uniref:hypothetical protein n=1 Tax=Segatella hominis TaxID=2518605 RepID=UPI0040387874
MDDFKNISKIFGILFFFVVCFTFQFRLWETDDDVKKRILQEEIPKKYDFKIISCDLYRGYNFVGINAKGDTVLDSISPFWDLHGRYSIGDKIMKKGGKLQMLLIRKNGDTVNVHLYYKRTEITN